MGICITAPLNRGARPPHPPPRVEHYVLVEIRAAPLLFICKCDYEPEAVAIQLGSSAIAICSVTHKEQFNFKVNLGCSSQCTLYSKKLDVLPFQLTEAQINC